MFGKLNKSNGGHSGSILDLIFISFFIAKDVSRFKIPIIDAHLRNMMASFTKEESSELDGIHFESTLYLKDFCDLFVDI